jgi:hypothetical protein
MSDGLPDAGGRGDTEPWWGDGHKSDRHRAAIAWTVAVRARQERWRKRDLLHACLYGNMEILGFGPSNYWRFGADDGRLTYNIIKPKADTWVSMICRSKPEPMFLPSPQGSVPGEKWTLKRKCQGMERFCHGQLEREKFHTAIAPLAVLDVGIFDFGIAKVSISGVDDQAEDWRRADVCVERAYTQQMVWNDAEALSGNIRTIAQRMPIDRYTLAAKFPKLKAKILDCPKGFQADEGGTSEEDGDVICVTEIWHLPSLEGTPDSKEWDGSDDGRHSLCIDNCTLFDLPYNENTFPFRRLTQMPVPWGIRGQSIAHQLRPVQVMINQLALDFQDAAATLARGKWLIPNQSGIDKGHVDDQVGSQLWYDAPYKPEAWCPPTIPPDIWQLFQFQFSMADDIIGISNGRSSGTVPTNLKSGEAIRQANDSQDGRFLISSGIFEDWCMQLNELRVDKARIIAKHRPDYASRYIDKAKAYSIIVPFKDVDLPRARYTIDCYAASALANTPGARYDQLKEMRDAGDLSRETYLKLLDWPDLAGEMKQLNAPMNLADMLIERFLTADDPSDPAVFLQPEPRWPLQILYREFLFAAAEAVEDEVPDANRELLERFMTALEQQATKIGVQLPGMPPPNMGAMNTAAPLGVAGGTPAPMMSPGGAGPAPPGMAPPGGALPPGAPPPMLPPGPPPVA